MVQTATITSKRQLTIPAEIFRKGGFREGQKVLVNLKKGKIYIEAAIDLVEQLAGSVTIPKRFRELTTEQIVSKAKKEYFSKK